MYDTILVPVDGSEQSERAVDHAIAIAEQFKSTVHALYVIDDRHAGRASEAVSELSHNSPERNELEQQRKQAGNELTESVLERARERGIDTENAVVSGDPAEAITDYAKAEAIDVIVLGARGRSAVGKFLLGDVAGKVARHATTPVLLIRADE
jgi:nucleotide-binding universal stress UspA family protein